MLIEQRGEINNTGDMIQAAIHLGRTGHPEYFEMAERMIRSHVLPSQWLKGQEFHRPADAPENALKEFPTDADGGWGFPGVSDRHVPGGRSDVLDITQGGIQCLWAALRHTLDQDQWGVRLNRASSIATSFCPEAQHLNWISFSGPTVSPSSSDTTPRERSGRRDHSLLLL